MENTITGPVVVVDGNSLAHRAFHAFERSEVTDRNGDGAWMLHGFVSFLASSVTASREHFGSVANVIVGFDAATSFRHEMFPAYKDGRSDKRPELVEQLARLPKFLTDLGVNVSIIDGYEADDVCATVARMAEEANHRCAIVTSDRDAFGAISETTEVFYVAEGFNNAVWMDNTALEAKYGISAGSYLTYAALRGDKSDNLEGIAGIGEKTAAKLLTHWGNPVEAAIADPDAVEAVAKPAVTRKLIAGKELFDRNIKMMRLATDVSVDVTASALPLEEGAVRSVGRSSGLLAIIPKLAPLYTATAQQELELTSAF